MKEPSLIIIANKNVRMLLDPGEYSFESSLLFHAAA